MNTKIVCQLNAAGYYIGTTVADESPLEPGIYLLPGGCIDAPTPTVPVGYRAYWNGVAFIMEKLPQNLVKVYILNILLWLDIGINVLLFGGSPYETISSRVGKQQANGAKWACIFCKLLDKLDTRHCENSQVPDYGKTLPNWWKLK